MNESRRGFFSWAGGLLASRGLVAANTTRHPGADGEDYYEKLGVTKIINAAGTFTMFTASTMPPSVQAAVAKAAKHAVSNCGVRFVEVETFSEYEAAFNDRTVLAHFFNAAEGGQISREDWIRIA